MVETRRARLVVVVVVPVVVVRELLCVAAARDGVGVARPTMRRKARRPRKVPQCRATCAIRASKSRAWTKSEEKDSSGGGGGCTTCGGILSTAAAGSGGGGGGSCIGATTWFGCKDDGADNEHVADCTAAAALSKDNLDSLSEAIQLATLLATRVAAVVSSCNVAPHSNRKVLSPNTLSPFPLCKDRTNNNDDDDASADDPYPRPE
jgi:hypothetical protein